MKEDVWFNCQFCSYQSTTLRLMNKHQLENHLDKLETDYSPNTKNWTYIRVKKECPPIPI